MIGDGNNRRTLVHVNDLCRAARIAAESEAAAGQVFNVTDGQIHTLREIIDAMSAALGKRSTRFVDKFVEDIAVSGEKMQKHLGYAPVYDLVEGWRETVRQMNTQQS